MAIEDACAQKRIHILDACCEENLDDLRHHATSEHGLIDDEVRKIAWPILLGSDRARDQHLPSSPQEHRDEHQVKLDVDRSFVYYPHGRQTFDTRRLRRIS